MPAGASRDGGGIGRHDVGSPLAVTCRHDIRQVTSVAAESPQSEAPELAQVLKKMKTDAHLGVARDLMASEASG